MATLYSYALAFNPPKALLILAEKRIPVRAVAVRQLDILAGRAMEPWFMKINPAATVPTLVLGNGRVLSSTAEIVKELDRGFGGPPLGSTAAGGGPGAGANRAAVEGWVDTLHAWDGNLYAYANSMGSSKGVLQLLDEHRLGLAERYGPKHPELAAAYTAKAEAVREAARQGSNPQKALENVKELEEVMDKAEALLASNGPFLLGAEYTAADAVLTAVLFRSGMGGGRSRLLKHRPSLASYWARMQARPSFAEVYGPALSKWKSLVIVAPALAKAYWARFTRRFRRSKQ